MVPSIIPLVMGSALVLCLMLPGTGLGQTSVHLYFATPDHAFLMAEEREMGHDEASVRLGRDIIQALIDGPRTPLMRTLPKETRLLGFYITDEGTAYVDFSEAVREYHPGGCRMEQLSIYSIVNSLILNIDRIRAVSVLIDGHEAQSLAGHIELRFPLSADMLIIR